ncbi:MAG TPA: cupin domain-containing protein [bacterium]|nr:cupin domain-containing protein [bacterium]
MEPIKTEWGEVVNLGQTKEFSCSLLRVMPGQKIPKHYHKRMREIEVVVGGEALVNGVKRSKDSCIVWETGQPHEYVNTASQTLEVICLVWPPYDPADEIPV